MELREQYKNLLTMQGVGKTLGLTIMTGPDRSADSLKSATIAPTAGKFQPNGSATIKKEGQRKQDERQ